MKATGTVHPPGGAAAVLAIVDGGARELRWKFVALVALGSCVLVLFACVVNNAVGRRYPVFWWSESPVGSWWRSRFGKVVQGDLEGCSVETGALEDEGRRCGNTCVRVLVVNREDVIRRYDLDVMSDEWSVVQRLMELLGREDVGGVASLTVSTESVAASIDSDIKN